MKTRFTFKWSHPARVILGLLAIFVIAACSSQAPTGVGVVQTATQDTVNPAIPNTGLASPTPVIAQTAIVQAPTQAATAQAASTQPVPTQTAQVQAQAVPAAPECKSPAPLTPALTEGPYFKANSPERTSLIETGMTGTQLVLTGYVLTTDCKPVAHAMIDFWQADAQGKYDNTGFILRGHQFTDAEGLYQLVTVIPGLYPGRSEHIHVKVQAPAGPVLTTQLFFPDTNANNSDSIYNPALLIALQGKGNPEQASFNFVIRP